MFVAILFYLYWTKSLFKDILYVYKQKVEKQNQRLFKLSLQFL
jgi:hypothetical protein